MANFEWISKVHRFVYHHSKGAIGGYLGRPMVLMYTIGAKSGLTRIVPLQCYPVEPEGVLVLASNNGQPKAPAWYHNLKAHPDIQIRLGRQLRHVHAEELNQEEREKAWPEMLKQNAQIETYASKAGRVLPIILLRTVTVH